MAQKKHVSRAKLRRRRKKMKLVLLILCILTVLILLCFSIFAVFRVKKIQVTGNQHTTTESVEQWIRKDKLSDNSLYVLWKYNLKSTKQLPSVESLKVSMKSPWVVNVKVNEKQLVGRIASGENNIYFDKAGIVCFNTVEVWDGMPVVEGVDLENTQPVPGDSIIVTDEAIFDNIHKITTLLNKNELTADKIVCDGKTIVLYFGNIKVAMGESNYEDKAAQIQPILEKMNSIYGGQSGTLHLENYEITNSSVRFVPDSAAAE